MIADMRRQEVRLKALLRALGVEQYAGINCEADDVMGRLSSLYSAMGQGVVIYTGDSDLRQLVNDSVIVVAPSGKGQDIVYNAAKVRERHEVAPELLADLKALAGDSSDNIPGVRGIGPKTAAALIAEHGDVEGILRAAHSEKRWKGPPRFRQSILQSKEEIRIFKKLTTINKEAEIFLIRPRRDKKRVIQHFRAYRFLSLMAPLELNTLMKMSGG